MITILKLMQTKLDHIVRTTLARPSLKEADREELLMLTREFPYSSVLQFLYTKRLQQSQDPRYGDSVTRTALFFNNPHWLFQQLRDIPVVEQVTLEEVAATATSPSPVGITDAGHLETLEFEGDSVPELSAAEQALIAALTEAPDGSIRPDAGFSPTPETIENESIAVIQDPAEVLEIETEAQGEETDIYAAEGMDDPLGTLDLTEESTDVDLSASQETYPAYTGPDEPVAEEIPAGITDEGLDLVIPDEVMTAEVVDDAAHIESEGETAMEMPVPASSEVGLTDPAEVIAAPADEWSAEPIEDESVSTEIGTSEEDRPETEDSADDDTQAAELPSSSLITVISSIEPQDANPIHTIGVRETFRNESSVTELSEMPEELTNAASDDTDQAIETEVVDDPVTAYAETDNDDDAAVSTNNQPAAETGSTDTVEPDYADTEADNDDDTSGLILTETADHTGIHNFDSPEAAFGEETNASGLEHLGFLPETLLEESDAGEETIDAEGGMVHTEPEFLEGWESEMPTSSDDAEDPDHPDATDPETLPAYDEHSPVINPGDLIRMAGLDQHHETELSFEPLHLTDYFASVGVSLPPDEQPDVFGRQSRSFTGWIRSMKRIHPEKTAVPFSQTESELIRSVADQSNEQEEVLTETMAEIYAMQGLTHKAIDIYEKLSLLNPDKSANFAARLSELKGRSS